MSVREGYKQTEIGVIPEKWDAKILSDVVNLIHGYQFRTTDFTEDGIAVIKIGNVNGTALNFENLSFISSDRYEEFKQYEIQSNDILMSLTGNIGRVVEVSNLPFTILQNYRVGKFEPINHFEIAKKYLKYLLSSQIVLDRLGKLSNQSAQANFGKQDMDKINVPLPPLPEQQKIAEILSTVDQKIDSIDSKIEETQTLKRGLMQRLLSEGIGHSEFKESEVGRIPAGWEVVELGEVAKLNKKKYTPTETETIKYIGLEHINQDNGTINGIGSSNEALSTKNCFDTGDILFGKLRPYLRKFYLSDFSGVCSTEILAIQAQKNILNTFLFKIIQTEEFINHSVSKVFGTKMPRTSWDILKEFKFALPPFEEQKQIAEILSTTDEKLETLRAKKDIFETLKKGLMQKLLSGEVRVK